MHVRRLRQAAPEQRPVYVSTPRELEDAILQGRLHIVITAHLDMTSMPLRDTSICPDGCSGPLPEIRETASIRVRSALCAAAAHLACMSPPPPPAAPVPRHPANKLLAHALCVSLLVQMGATPHGCMLHTRRKIEALMQSSVWRRATPIPAGTCLTVWPFAG